MVAIRADRQSATEREQDAANHRCHRESNTEQGRRRGEAVTPHRGSGRCHLSRQ
jgi:hypothetical protein